MTIHVQIQDEWGVRDSDPFIWDWHFANEEILRGHESSYSCLRFIDPYGDTTFNYLQAAELVEELHRVRSITADPAHAQALEQLSRLAQLAADRHRYIKFVGD